MKRSVVGLALFLGLGGSVACSSSDTGGDPAGAGGAAGGSAGAAGAAGVSAAAGTSGGTSLTGTLGALGPMKPTVSSLFISNSGETLIYMSSAPLTCEILKISPWLRSAEAGSQVVEIVIKGNPKAGQVVTEATEGEVNYAEGGKSSSYEINAKTDTITFTKAEAKGVVEGTLMATYDDGSMISGTFHAEFCDGGQGFLAMNKHFSPRSLLLAIALVAAGCSTSSSDSSPGESGGAAGGSGAAGSAGAAGQAHMPTAVTGTVERGQYLVDHVLACGVCHTPNGADGKPDPTKYLAGSRSYDFTDKDGTIITVNAENLTSHNPEGLFTWTDEQIRSALTVGIDDEKIPMYPIMPYPEYSLLTKSDIDSIIQYLRTVAPNDNVVAADYPYFDQNPPAPPIDGSMVPHTTLAASDPDYAAAERGRYLAAAACLNCHTEQLGEDVPNLAKAFAGGKKYTLIRGAPQHTSVNLTPDKTGLADWSVSDIVASIKTNTEKGTGRVLCNSHPGGDSYLGKMADGDLQDIATYLRTLPPVANGPFQCVQ